MFARIRSTLIGSAILIFAGTLLAQPQPAKLDPPPSRDAVAGRVNGQAIHELAVYRALLRVTPARRAEARKEVINYLIDNMIVDQYLLQLKIPVDQKEVEEHIQKLKEDAVREKQDFNRLLADLHISEDELRSELVSALRWDKFVLQQGNEKVLQDMFVKNVDMFNGSRMSARHILIPVKNGNQNEAYATIVAVKRNIEAEVNQSLAKLPPNIDAITREKERARTVEKVFSDSAAKYSTCPSSKEGGDLGFFKRAGDMVEPFARVAFALKPYQMSDPVATEFGYHLILAIDYKPGKDVKYEQVKPFVQEVYADRLREAILAAYKTKSKIEIFETKK